MTAQEWGLLSALLAADFPGRPALVVQAASVSARQVDEEGSLELSTTGAPAAVVNDRIPVEAEVEDADGVKIHILLHVVDGRMNELEVYREDNAALREPIRLDALRVLVF